MSKRPTIAAAFVFAVYALMLSGCATMTGGPASRVTLVPEGRSINAPYVVGYVKKNSPASSVVSVGDTVLKVRDTKVSASTFFKETHNSTGYALVKDGTGHTKQVPMATLVDAKTGYSYTMPFKLGGTFLFKLKVPAYGRSQPSGYFVVDHESGVIAASLWRSSPRVVEVYLSVTAAQNCDNCAVKFVGLMDLPDRSWLPPISPKQVAVLLYPPAGSPPPMMNVPPPVKVASTTFSNSNGLYRGQFYGNSMNGSYSGTTTSTTVPYYNYTATDMALAENLASIIAQDKIIQNNRDRRKFLLDRISNFRAGAMNPGETEAAYFDFVVPKGMKGPFAVGISDGKRAYYVTFTHQQK